MHFNFSIPRLFKLLFKQMNISEMKKQSKNRAHHLKETNESFWTLWAQIVCIIHFYLCTVRLQM